MSLKSKIKKNRYNRIDITSYSDNELSLLTYNTYELYNIRYSLVLVDILKRLYRFTDSQLNVLLNDLTNELKENK
tara:strand:+ start:739 stop:963 length:225 start_codon:yes stop_codon:yes gene_type:complete